MLLNVKLNIRKAIGHFICAYIIVTILAYSVSYLVGMMLKLPPPAPGVSIFDDPVFVKTVPYHLLINLLAWALFSYVYFRKNKKNPLDLSAAVYLGFFWLILSMTVDLIFFVMIPSPVSLTFRQFYIEYQPWISITYLIVLISPLISYGLIKNRVR